MIAFPVDHFSYVPGFAQPEQAGRYARQGGIEDGKNWVRTLSEFGCRTNQPAPSSYDRWRLIKEKRKTDRKTGPAGSDQGCWSARGWSWASS